VVWERLGDSGDDILTQRGRGATRHPRLQARLVRLLPRTGLRDLLDRQWRPVSQGEHHRQQREVQRGLAISTRTRRTLPRSNPPCPRRSEPRKDSDAAGCDPATVSVAQQAI